MYMHSCTTNVKLSRETYSNVAVMITLVYQMLFFMGQSIFLTNASSSFCVRKQREVSCATLVLLCELLYSAVIHLRLKAHLLSIMHDGR